MLRDKLNLALITGIIIAVYSIVFYSLAPAAVAQSYDDIDITAQDGSTAISTITFPPGAAGATITDPYNDVDTVSSSQAFGGSSVPVVELSSATAYTVSVTISDGSGTDPWDTVADTEYLLIDSAQTGTVADMTGATSYSTWGSSLEIGTIDTDGNDLYLTLDLENVSGKSAESTITFLGET